MKALKTLIQTIFHSKWYWLQVLMYTWISFFLAYSLGVYAFNWQYWAITIPLVAISISGHKQGLEEEARDRIEAFSAGYRRKCEEFDELVSRHAHFVEYWQGKIGEAISQKYPELEQEYYAYMKKQKEAANG